MITKKDFIQKSYFILKNFSEKKNLTIEASVVRLHIEFLRHLLVTNRK